MSGARVTVGLRSMLPSGAQSTFLMVLEGLFSPGEKILLKPDLLHGLEPDRCVTTHPAVVAAIARLLVEHGCRVLIADSPGGGVTYSEANLRRAYARAGYMAAEETGAALNYDTGSSSVSFPQGAVMRQFSIITPCRGG